MDGPTTRQNPAVHPSGATDVRVVEAREDAERAVAREIGELVQSRRAAGRTTVLGLATGGTMQAAMKLVQKVGGSAVGCLFVIELGFLPGRERLGDVPVHSLIRY